MADLQVQVKLLEIEKRSLEIELQMAQEQVSKLKDHLKEKGKSQKEMHGILFGEDPDRDTRQLKARIAVLERENEWLRSANEALATGKQPEEVMSEIQIPKKKIKNPGRPGINSFESGQMRTLRKDGWTVREIAETFGRSVGAVQKIVADSIPDPEAIKRHRDERNRALTDSKKAARVARKMKNTGI